MLIKAKSKNTVMPKLKLHKLNQRGFDHVFTLAFVALAIGIIGTFFIVRSHANPSPRTNFIDISEPECSKLGSIKRYGFGIVGLNGSRMDFARNPCLSKELRHFKTYGLYLGANYPSKHCSSHLTPYQCGQLAGKYDLRQMSKLHPQSLWIDVESGPNIPWSTTANNANFVTGLYDTVKAKGVPVGFYSNVRYWKEIMGDKQYSNAINWYPFGSKDGHTVDYLCKSKQFGGGTNAYVQWVDSNGLDRDSSC